MYKLLLMFLVFGLFTSLLARERTICGAKDDRVLSEEKPFGRLHNKSGRAGCSGTLIGRSCFITAGHCGSTFYTAQFNTPTSNFLTGTPKDSNRRDRYGVDRSTIVNGMKSLTKKKDFAVMKLKKNAITGLYPGDVQGYVDVDFNEPTANAFFRITGYGIDRTEPRKNQAQQTHFGDFSKLSTFGDYGRLAYRVDTMGGNSGSSVIDEVSGKVVGIHTHGGCVNNSSSANAGTSIYGNKELIEAIQACLATE